MNLSESLSPDGVSDLVARLGYPTDRRNIVLALTAQPVAGVVPSPRRGIPWSIPLSALVDVVAALMLRRERRSGAMSYRRELPLDRYRLPAAEIVMRDPELGPLVPPDLRKRILMAERARRAVAAERQRQRQAAIEAEQRAAERWQQHQSAQLRDLTTLLIYSECRQAASAARFPMLDKAALESPAFSEFLDSWPYPGDRPSWRQAPPGVLEEAIELLRPWVAGEVRTSPDLRHLVPKIDLLQPWPWRAPDAA